MSAAPSQPFLAGGGLWDAASSFLSLGTNALSYQEASPSVEHFACQGTAATGTGCAQTSNCSCSPSAPACSEMFLCPAGCMESHPLQSKHPG